jgi:hypothetical protein
MVALAELSFDLKQLPIRAMVAYASRCARRAQPLLKLGRKHRDPETCRKTVDSAIRLAEAFAAGGEIEPQVVAQFEEIMVQALLSVSALGEDFQTAAYAANAAYAVLSATSAALEIEAADDPTELANRVLDACATATESAISADDAVERAARLDWEMLHRMRLGRFPDLGEPINPTESGILGPLYCLRARTHRSHKPEPVENRAAAALAATAPGPVAQSDPEPVRERQEETSAAATNPDAPAAEPTSETVDAAKMAGKAKSLAARIRARREKLAL